MPRVHKEIRINAPPDAVFRLTDDPEAFPRFSPNISEVSEIHRSEGRVGDTFRATYSMLGLRMPVTFTYAEYQPGQRLAARFEGPFSGRMATTLKARGSETDVSLDLDYELPGGALGKAMNRVLVERMQEKQAEHLLENMKLLAESEQGT